MRSQHIVLVLGLFVFGCSSSPSSGDDAATDEASTDDGSSTDDATPMDDAADATAPDTGSAPDTGVMSGDGFGAARTACINEINKLRATQNHKAYALWTSASTDKCVDDQATNDEKNMSPHQAWLQQKYPACNGNGQDECLGYGVTPSGIVKCLDAMWNEKNQPNCAGCPACSGSYNPNCPNCDFYGKNGPECGHYVNMSADYFSKAACGFSALGGWAVQNFSQ